MTGLHRAIGSAAVAILLVGVSLLAGAGSASAYARGCQAYNGVQIQGYNVGSGVFCMQINGTREYVESVQTNFNSVGNVCNWEITAEFFDADWRWKSTQISPRKSGCQHSARDLIMPVNTLMRTKVGASSGYLCSTLRQGGKRTASACHFVHA